MEGVVIVIVIKTMTMNKLNRFKTGRDNISTSEQQILSEISQLDMQIIRQEQLHRDDIMHQERLNF